MNLKTTPRSLFLALVLRGDPLLTHVLYQPRERTGLPNFGVANLCTLVCASLGRSARWSTFEASRKKLEHLQDCRRRLSSNNHPAMWVFGFQRSGTRSLRSIISVGYPNHYFRNELTHNPYALRRLLAESGNSHLAFVVSRDPVDAICSLAVKRFGGPPPKPDRWIPAQARNWRRFDKILAQGGSRTSLVHVPFTFLESGCSPSSISDILRGTIVSMECPNPVKFDLDFEALHRVDLEKWGETRDPFDIQNGNLPSVERQEIVGAMKEMVRQTVIRELGTRCLRESADRDARRSEVLLNYSLDSTRRPREQPD